MGQPNQDWINGCNNTKILRNEIRRLRKRVHEITRQKDQKDKVIHEKSISALVAGSEANRYKSRMHLDNEISRELYGLYFKPFWSRIWWVINTTKWKHLIFPWHKKKK